MLVLSSPSGAGKTAICRAILEGDAAITLSVSVTTRPMRPGEVDGADYVFVDDDRFAKMVADGAFLEHATVFGHSYGTPRAPVEAALEAGRDVLFDVDWQGAQQLAQSARADLASIFILPPSTAELARRLRARAQDPPDVVAARMARAADETSHWAEYDYVIVNEDLDESTASARAILHAERLRRTRRVGLVDFVKALSERR
ncbi:MAG: guanylate kinase [Alphaproteobacteria bacterium]